MENLPFYYRLWPLQEGVSDRGVQPSLGGIDDVKPRDNLETTQENSSWGNCRYLVYVFRCSKITSILHPVKQIRRVFEDNFHYFSIKTYVVGTHKNRLAEAILMSTHNICFCGALSKIILQLSSNSLLICSTESFTSCGSLWASKNFHDVCYYWNVQSLAKSIFKCVWKQSYYSGVIAQPWPHGG